MEGIITSDPEDKKTYWRYEVSVKKSGDTIAPVSSQSKILVKEKSRSTSTPSYGDHIHFVAKLSKPKVIESDDGRDFDYEYFLQKDNIFYLGDVEQVQLIDTNQANKVTYVLYKIKKKFMQNVERLLPAPYAFLATGLVISGKGSLDAELQTQFQKVGLIHIVVLSGSNVSIVGEAISKFFSFLPKLWGGVLGSLGIILFGTMTGGGATVCRSVIMSIIGIYARLSERKNSGLVSLMFAGALMLIQNPKLLLHDPSFQLSFMATLGLICLAGPIEEFLKKTKTKVESYHRVFLLSLKIIPQSLISLIATTIATQVFTLPFIIRFSGVVSLVALPVNTVILPFIPLTMFFVFLAGSISFISQLIAYLPALVSYSLLKYELMVVGYFSSLSFSAIKLPNISSKVFFSSYVVMGILVLLLNSKNIRARDTRGVKINTTPV